MKITNHKIISWNGVIVGPVIFEYEYVLKLAKIRMQTCIMQYVHTYTYAHKRNYKLLQYVCNLRSNLFTTQLKPVLGGHIHVDVHYSSFMIPWTSTCIFPISHSLYLPSQWYGKHPILGRVSYQRALSQERRDCGDSRPMASTYR